MVSALVPTLPVVLTNGAGKSVVAGSAAEYWNALWSGYTVSGPVPAPPRNKIPATLADLDGLKGAAPADLDTLQEISSELKGRLAQSALSATYAGRLKTLAQLLKTTQRGIDRAFPAANAALATVTVGSSATITGRVYQPSAVEDFTALGGPVSWNQPLNYLDNTANSLGGSMTWGPEFDVYDTAVEVRWRALATDYQAFWIWVDDQPLTAAPVGPGISTVAGTTYYTKIDFGSVGHHRVRVLWKNAGLRGIAVAVTGSIAATPKPTWSVAVLGDSYTASANGVTEMDTYPLALARLLGADLIQCGQGGTGYASPGTGNARAFTDSARLSALAAGKPDLVVILGSVNDDNKSGVQAAAASVYSQLATLLPTVPVVVVGPPPSNATDSLSANRSANIAAVKAAAVAAPNVVGFIDAVGTAAGVPSAYANGGVYAVGDRMTYQGAVYTCRFAHTGAASPNLANFALQSWLTGTGQVGTLANNGERDLFLSNDGVHWSPAGHKALARRMAAAISRTLSGLVA